MLGFGCPGSLAQKPEGVERCWGINRDHFPVRSEVLGRSSEWKEGERWAVRYIY